MIFTCDACQNGQCELSDYITSGACFGLRGGMCGEREELEGALLTMLKEAWQNGHPLFSGIVVIVQANQTFVFLILPNYDLHRRHEKGPPVFTIGP